MIPYNCGSNGLISAHKNSSAKCGRRTLMWRQV